MHFLTLLRDYLWVAPAIFQVAIVVVMARRGLYRKFPFFFVYNLECILGPVTLFAMYLSSGVSGRAWVSVYFLDTSLSTALRFAVIYEIFNSLFSSYAALSRFGRPVFRGTILLLLGVSIALAIFTKGKDADFPMYALHVLEQSVSILQVGLLVVLFSISAYIGLSWRSGVFGMALGLGTYASVKLGAAALQAYGVGSGNTFVNLIVMGAFHVSVLIWLYYVYAKEPARVRPITGIPEHNLEVWNEELQRLLQQ